MRVAIVVEEFPSLSQTFVLNQITGLLDNGFEVDIYAESKGTSTKIHPDVCKYNLLDRCKYIKIPKKKVGRILKAVAIILKSLNKNPIRLFKSLNLLKYGKDSLSLRIFYYVFYFEKLKKIEKYDVIYCHFGPSGIIGAALRDLNYIDGKVVTTFHGYDISKFLKVRGRKVYNFLFEKGDLFLPISNRWEKKLVELGAPEEKIRVLRMGIDPKKFEFVSNGIRGNKIRLLTIARLVEKKGVSYGIEAVNQVIDDHPDIDIEYVIVGDGPLKPELDELIEQLRVGGKIKLAGWKEQSEITRLLEQTNILLAPSVTSSDGDQEGIPVAIMEAMAMGKPVISTFHSGIPELIEDGVTGYLVPERDVESLVEKISFLVEHPDLWRELGENGRRVIEENYNIEALVKELVFIFRNIEIVRK